MTAQRKPKKNDDVGNAKWVKLLAQCIDSIGNGDFPQRMVDALNTFADIDYSVAYAYSQSERPLCLFHTFSAEKRVTYVDNYQKGPYLLDPFFKACSRKIDTGLYRISDIAPDRFYQSEYYRSYYNQTGLSDEICYTFYLDKGVAVVISLMRSGEGSRFSAREFRLLDSVVPIVVSLAQRHWHDIPDNFNVDADFKFHPEDYSFIENTVSDMFSKRLTPRETQVVAQVLEGHSSDSIGKDLGISVGTVRIHRRNIYAKLQISSQQELFSIFFKKITKDR
ncbi:MAG: helix-turn-helix transcriptional regulator [Rhodospirillales bacterium]|nr:helix-turn-helix transcriptional regulator [Rhodospirillales bacterium]